MGDVFTSYSPQRARWRALQSATTEAGEFLMESSPYLIQTNQKYGGISDGASADPDDGDFGNIVIIDGDPIGDDISNTQQIIEVVYHGTVIDRRDLQNEFCSEVGGADGCVAVAAPGASGCTLQEKRPISLLFSSQVNE